MKLSAQERHKGKKNKMEKKRIILASGSPRRKELLLQIGIVPEIIVSHVVTDTVISLKILFP